MTQFLHGAESGFLHLCPVANRLPGEVRAKEDDREAVLFRQAIELAQAVHGAELDAELLQRLPAGGLLRCLAVLDMAAGPADALTVSPDPDEDFPVLHYQGCGGCGLARSILVWGGLGRWLLGRRKSRNRVGRLRECRR